MDWQVTQPGQSASFPGIFVAAERERPWVSSLIRQKDVTPGACGVVSLLLQHRKRGMKENTPERKAKWRQQSLPY
jgi:hypothetical protein